ncbi:MAG: ParB/RepB/Spo0J family partition protein [Rhizomicrobium sp.]
MSPEIKKSDDARARGLGRGLSALLGDDTASGRGAAEARNRGGRSLPVAFLRPNRFQPRKRFTEADLSDLVESIKEKGVLQPILVRPVAGEIDAYEIVAGERRWRAAQKAKLHDVPVVIREMSDRESLEIAIIENVQRADLNAIEEAAAYHELMERFEYTQEQVAKQVGKSRSHVANTLRLLTLPPAVQVLLQDGSLTAGHARTLVGDPNAEARAREIIAGALNVRQSEKRTGQKKSVKLPQHDPDILALEDSISNRLGLKVTIIDHGDKGGEVHINYLTLEQLDDIANRLKRG